MSFFERTLSLWVFGCIVVGIALGQFFPAAFQTIGTLEIARVNLPVGVLIWDDDHPDAGEGGLWRTA